jgi:hypothetical protein
MFKKWGKIKIIFALTLVSVFLLCCVLTICLVKKNKNPSTNLNVEAAYDFKNGALTTSSSNYNNNSVFYIGTPTALDNFSKSVANDCTFKDKAVHLTSNINMSGRQFVPIGATIDDGYYRPTVVKRFYGKFYGQNFVVSNLTTSIPDCPFNKEFQVGFLEDCGLMLRYII